MLSSALEEFQRMNKRQVSLNAFKIIYMKG